jgi:hypothetical protein
LAIILNFFIYVPNGLEGGLGRGANQPPSSKDEEEDDDHDDNDTDTDTVVELEASTTAKVNSSSIELAHVTALL